MRIMLLPAHLLRSAFRRNIQRLVKRLSAIMSRIFSFSELAGAARLLLPSLATRVGASLRPKAWLASAVGVALLAGCAGPDLPPPPLALQGDVEATDYIIAPLDSLQIFVWQAGELNTAVPVRPDGKISIPLVEDLPAAGLTPTELARDLEEALSPYVQNPIVTVIVQGFGTISGQTIRVVGEAQAPVAIPYRSDLTILDVMVAVGGLTPFAAGNSAVLVRQEDTGEQQVYGVRLSDLINNGDLQVNRPVRPGDVLIIPKSFL